MKDFFREKVLPFLVFIVYRLLLMTWRVTIVETDELKESRASQEAIIFAHWHGDELALVSLVPEYRIATMTSKSRDGRLIESVICRLGGASSKGSSSRGAAQGLKGLIRLVKQGRPASIAVDGPRGPIYEPKPGVFELSRISKAKIYPVASACDRSIFFKKSWNKTYLPKPFAKVAFIFGRSLGPVDRSMDPRSEELKEELKNELQSCRTNAKHHIASLS